MKCIQLSWANLDPCGSDRARKHLVSIMEIERLGEHQSLDFKCGSKRGFELNLREPGDRTNLHYLFL